MNFHLERPHRELARFIRSTHQRLHETLRDYPGVDLMWTEQLKRAFLSAMEKANQAEADAQGDVRA